MIGAAASANAISASGTVSATNTMTLTTSNAAGGIALSGTVSAATLDVSAGTGGISQGGGSIKADVLTSAGGSKGNVLLNEPGNAIGKLGAFDATGVNFVLQDSLSLTVAGPLVASIVNLSSSAAATKALDITGNITTGSLFLTASNAAGGIALSGDLVSTGVAQLTAGSGGIIQSAGSFQANVLATSVAGGGVVLTQLGNSVVDLIGGTVASGDFSLTSSSFFTVGGVLADNVTLRSVFGDITTKGTGVATQAAGTILLEAAGAIVLQAPVNAGAGTVDLRAAAISQTAAGAITAGTLTSIGTVAGAVLLDKADNTIATIGSLVANGDIALRDVAALTVATALSGANVSIIDTSAAAVALTVAAGAKVQAGAGGTIALSATGGMTFAGTLDATPAGTMTLTAGGGLSQFGGAITAGAVTMSAGGDMALAGTVDATATGTVSLAAKGGLTQSGGAITAGALAMTSGGNMALAGIVDATAVGAIALQVGGAFTQSAGAITAGALDFASVGGAVTQTGGTIAAGILGSSGGIGGPVSLGQVGNAIGTLSAMTITGGGLTLADSLALSVAGALMVTGGDVAISGSGGAIAVNAAIVTDNRTVTLTASAPDGGIGIGADITATTLNLAAGTGGVVQTGGVLNLGTLASPGIGGAASFNQPGNRIAAVGAFTLGGSFSLVDQTALTVAGPLAAGGGITLRGNAAATPAITVSGTTTSGLGMPTTLETGAGGIAITGQINVPGGLLNLTTATGVKAVGNIAAGKLEVSATTPGAHIELTGAGNSVGILKSASLADGTFLLNNSTPLTISGSITARLLGVNVTNALTILDGVAISTDGISRATQYPLPMDNVAIAALDPTTGGTAKFGSFMAVKSAIPGKIEIGDITVTPFSPGPATFDLILPNVPGGTINIGELKAPSIDLILVSRFGGSSKGNLDVAALLVLGAGGNADLSGKIGGLEGQAAASKATIWPQPSSDYRFNACPITSINCVLLPVQTIPPISPLRDVPIIRDRPSQDDTDVQLPNVSDEDY